MFSGEQSALWQINNLKEALTQEQLEQMPKRMISRVNQSLTFLRLSSSKFRRVF